MGVDLHRIGFGISSGSSRNGFGNIVSFPSVSFPAYGSFNSNLNDVDYLAGTSYTIQSVAYFEKTADYIVKNDGVGGTYTDYATASDITYRTGSFLQTTNQTHDGNFVTLPYGLGSFATQQFAGYDYTWNGSPYGGYTQYDYSVITTYSNQIGANDYTNTQNSPNYYIVNVYGQDLQNGKYTYYSVSGAGSFNSNDNQGSFHSYGTPTGQYDGASNPVYWDGNGGYYS